MSQRTPQKRRRWPPLFVALLVGFLLGAIAVYLLKTPAATLSSKLLEWPFLTFLLVACFVLLFFNSLEALIARGEFTIAWGKDQSIKVRDLSSALDEELDPIRDDIEELKKGGSQNSYRPNYVTLRKPTNLATFDTDETNVEVFQINPPVAPAAAAAPFPGYASERHIEERIIAPAARTPSVTHETTESKAQKLHQALESPNFKWRSIETLANVTDSTQEEVAQLVISQPDMRLSRGKSGRQIAGLISRVGA